MARVQELSGRTRTNPQQRLPNQLRTWIPGLALLGIFASSCGEARVGGEPQATTRHFGSLELRSSPPRADNASIERYQRLLPSPDRPWLVNEKPAQLIALRTPKGEQQRHVLVVNEEGSSKINFPGPFDGREFNTVAIVVEARRKLEFTLNFIARGQLLKLRGAATARGVSGKQTLHFDLPTLYRPTEKIDRMRLICGTRLEDFRVHSVDLLRKPLGHLLPVPEEGPDLILVGSEKRRGVGISTEYGVQAECDAHEGTVLRFSYAAPGQPQVSPGDEQLELTIKNDQGRTESHSFTPLGGEEFGWHAERVSLASFAGEHVRLHWSVQAAPRSNWALAEVGILTGVGKPLRVLLITSDTHRADHLGAATHSAPVRTPYLDALAERGVLFEDCYTTTNITNPSHIALMTGRHPRDTGILTNNEPVSLAADTLAEAFHGAGFATYASVSARHLGSQLSGLGQGFDRLSEPRLSALREGQVSVMHMDLWLQQNLDVPVFMWIHVFDAHVPYAPPADLLESYYPNPAAAFDPHAPPITSVPARVYERIFPGLKDLDYPKALYAGEVTYLDRELNRILSRPAMQQAIIGFTSDHGESLGQHGVFFAHADLFPDSLHVPLILSFPGAQSGLRSTLPVRQIDLGRTLLDLAGRASVDFPGNNLLEQASARPCTDLTRFALGAGTSSASISRGSWHLIFALTNVRGHHRIDERALHSVALYNLSEDPDSLHDLVDEEFDRAQSMRDELIAWLADGTDLGWRGTQVVDEKTLRSLEALGYTAGATPSEPSRTLYDSACDCAWCKRFADN